jgi:parallel beta-helix repeat protein
MRPLRIALAVVLLAGLGQILLWSWPLAQQQPILQVSPTSLSFEGQVGGPTPDPQALTISNAGGGLMEWKASTDAGWIILGATEGKLSGGRAIQMWVFVDIAGMRAGTYQGKITIEAPGAEGSPVQVAVTLTLATPPRLEVSPSSLEFQAQEGGNNPASKTLTIRNSGGQSLSWEAAVDVTWVILNWTRGSLEPGASQSLTVTVRIAGLAAGTHQAIITVKAPGVQGSPATVTVTLRVEPRPRYTVCPTGCPFSRIQAAVDASHVGEIITISPGTYDENLQVTKSLTLRGAGYDQTIIRSGQVGKVNAVINITGSGFQVNIEGITISGARRVEDYGGHGIWADGNGKVLVQSCKVSDNESNGIGTDRGIEVTIRDSLVVNNRWGIVVWGTGAIQNNTISGNGMAIQMTGVRTLIQGNTISDNNAAIWAGSELQLDQQVTIKENKISRNRSTGILLVGRLIATISSNNILDNGGWGVAAYLRKCGYDRDNFTGNVTLNNNTITGNKQGQVCLP